MRFTNCQLGITGEVGTGILFHMEAEIEEIKKELFLIKNRNKIVEENKAWEISLFRRVSIICLTYVLAAIVMYTIGVPNFLLNAFIPMLGYALSTLSLSFLKKWWLSNEMGESVAKVGQ